MKTIRWNIGLFIVKIGYNVRKYDFKPNNYSLRWAVGKLILRIGYMLRDKVPQKTYKWAMLDHSPFELK